MQWLYFTQVSEPWLEAGDMCNSRILLVCVSRLHLIDLLAYFKKTYRQLDEMVCHDQESQL